MPHKCRICDNVEGNVTHKAREMMFGLREQFDYIECANCRCIQIANVPADLGRHYPENYYAYQQGTPEISPPWKRRLKAHYSRHELGRKDAVGWFLSRTNRVVRIDWVTYAKPDLDEPLLDIGCGNGYELNRMCDRGYTNLTGIDPFIEKDITYENGVKLYKRDIADMQGSFKTILLNHTFEHLPDPLGSLQDISRLLQPGGTVVIRIPVSNCFAWEKYGVDWVQLDAPRHLFLHNEQTLGILSAQSGLKVKHVVYDSWSFQFQISEGYRRGASYVDQCEEPPVSKETLAEYNRQSAALNTEKRGDQATFYLTRSSSSTK
jgi:SAM-dependent methyltransferase